MYPKDVYACMICGADTLFKFKFEIKREGGKSKSKRSQTIYKSWSIPLCLKCANRVEAVLESVWSNLEEQFEMLPLT